MKLSKTNLASLIVKRESLAAESRIIKHQRSHKFNKDQEVANSLNLHLQTVVKTEGRATGLAIAFLNGVEYRSVENSRKESKELVFRGVVVPAMLRIVKKYGYKSDTVEKDVLDWLA